jgi:hypothetical protein
MSTEPMTEAEYAELYPSSSTSAPHPARRTMTLPTNPSPTRTDERQHR